MVERYHYSSIKEVAEGADCLVVLVEHQSIREELTQEEAEINQAMHHPLILRFYQDEVKSPLEIRKTTSIIRSVG